MIFCLNAKVKPESGRLYRGLVQYDSRVDQLNVLTRSLQFELHIPGKVVKWTTDMAIGTKVTVTNRLQIEGYVCMYVTSPFNCLNLTLLLNICNMYIHYLNRFIFW